MSTMIDCNTGNIRCEHIQGSNLTAVYTTNKNGGTKVWIWDSSSKKYTAKGNLTSQDTHNVMYDKEHYTMRIENGKVFVSQYKQDEPHINTTPSGTSYVANINGKKVTALVVGGLVIGLVAVGVLIWLKNPIAAGNAAVGTGEIIGGTEGATVIKHILDRIASILFPLLLIPEELQAKEAFSQANQAGIPGADPILVDLNGDGVIGTTSVRDGVYFDHQVDGFAESSAWVDENDGILVIDKNNNGVIDNGGEVFGDNYVKEDGSKASSGFDALADLDSNNDGVISIEDESFGLIKILKGDGELIGLEEAGIVS